MATEQKIKTITNTDVDLAAVKSVETKSTEAKIVIYTGLALFAMFFGAGNIVFPLYIGANSGSNILISLIGFLFAAVGVPFLGLIAISLYRGNYFDFLARLGKIPALIIILLIMIVLGPLGAMPRTETTTFNTLLPYLPEMLKDNRVFSIIYLSLVSLLAYREAKVVKILGLFLSPIKILAFGSLVVLGLLLTEPPSIIEVSAKTALHQAISLGYGTMDLLAGMLFCSIAFRSIQLSTATNPQLDPTKLTIKSCIIGASLISLLYTGFMLVSYYHAESLQNISIEHSISAVSHAVLGRFGGLFVCIAVSGACLATTLALGLACSHCLYQEILKGYLPKQLCFALVIVSTYGISTLGFQGILDITIPIVGIIYPALIVHCVFSILYHWKGIKLIRLPVFSTLALSIGYALYNAIF